MSDPHSDIAWPASAHRVLQADSLRQLERTAGELARRILGASCVINHAFYLLIEEDIGYLIHTASLMRERFYKPLRLRPSISRLAAANPRELAIIDEPLQIEDGETAAPPLPSAATLVLPLYHAANAPDNAETCRGYWLIGLAAMDPSQAARFIDDHREALTQLGHLVSRISCNLLELELTRSRSRQLFLFQEEMQRCLLATDQNDLLNHLLLVLTRHAELDRVLISLLQPEAGILRHALHTDFDTAFLPDNLSIDQRDHFIIETMNRGEPLVLESARHPLPPIFHALDPAPERLALIPLMVGHRPLGIIYGDQPRHDGLYLSAQALQIIGRIGGAALESLRLRVNAEQRAETDALTGLYNRFFLDKLLQIEVPRVKRYNQPISLLMLDLTGFKHINDTYGHPFGDFILRETANLLQANVRKPDFVIRYGGDEFIVFMVNTTHAQALKVCDRIERAFAERNRLQDDPRTMIEVSLGLHTADAENIDQIVFDADQAMYAQKARSRRRQLIDALVAGNADKIEKVDKVVGSLCSMLFKKEPSYADHARRVTHLALQLGRRVDLPPEDLETLALGALLHDVGKVSIPTEVLQKKGPLSPSEREALRHHPVLGEEFFEGLQHLEPIRSIVRHHHERFDGRLDADPPGYPDGLAGGRIPLMARIVRVAEYVDRLREQEDPHDQAAAKRLTDALRAEMGAQLDPRLTTLLLAEDDWRRDLGDPAAIEALLPQ